MEFRFHPAVKQCDILTVCVLLHARHHLQSLPVFCVNLAVFLQYIGPFLFTYLVTSWSRVLLEKLTGFAASQEIPRIFGTRRFITVLTSARHLSLS